MKHAILLAATCLAAIAMSQPADDRKQIIPSLTVSAEATIEIEPDMATVRLGITNQALTAKDAQRANAATATKIVDALAGIVGDRKAIQTSGLSLQPMYATGNNQAPRITGYMATNSVTVMVYDLAKTGPVIDAAREAGANTVDFVTFGLRNSQPATLDALAKAAQAAKAKAEKLASALGLKLESVLSVSEGSSPQPVMGKYMMRNAGAMAADANPVEPGKVPVDATVTITYRISG